MRDGGKFTAGAVLLGIGTAGFVDGIVLHQLLQWHHMVSDTGDNSMYTVAGLEVNTFADGLFHAAAFLATLLGVLLLYQALRHDRAEWSTSGLLARILIGFGGFNLVEGIVDHHVLGIHHVNQTVARADWFLWDVGFLVLLGAVPLLIGVIAIARSR
jgi:uncharacterized membrane protein